MLRLKAELSSRLARPVHVWNLETSVTTSQYHQRKMMTVVFRISLPCFIQWGKVEMCLFMLLVVVMKPVSEGT